MSDAPMLDELLLRAERYADVNRHDLAESELRKAIALEPDAAPLHGQLAIALWRQKRLVEAEAEFKECLRLDPQDDEAMRFMAVMFMDEGRHSEAEQLLIDSIRLEPVLADGYLFYGLLMYKTEKLEKAEQLLRRCLALQPDMPYAHSQLAAVLALRNSWKEAHAHGEAGLAMAPGDEWSHTRMGVTYLQTGHPFKAREHLREALRLNPTDGDLVEAYEEADRACRWLYWPVYQYAVWTSRLPGKHLSVWLAIILAYHTTRHMTGPLAVGIKVVWGTFIAFVIYTWVATPLVKAWIRLRPPQ